MDPYTVSYVIPELITATTETCSKTSSQNYCLVKQSYSKTPLLQVSLPFLQVLTQEDENGNVKLECLTISKQQF
ncbi:hypothetical protein YC2023_051896 [Brassica napus]